MKKRLDILYVAPAIAFLIFLQACSSVPINLSTAKEEVIKYHKSGMYDKDVSEAVENAINKFKDVEVHQNSAVVFDIDETSLSNYKYSLEYDFGFVQGTWDKWVNDAKAPPVKEVKHLYDYLVNRGFKIIFITGRKDYQYKATYKNLINAGYTKFDTLIVRSSSEYKLTAREYKSNKRIALTRSGYNIVGDIGDQYSDLEGPDHGIRVKIPNFQYLIK